MSFLQVANWQQIGDVPFRKFELYDMLWEDMELDQFIVAVAPFGGPIAMARDPNKVIRVRGNRRSSKAAAAAGPTRSLDDVAIFSASGKLLATNPCRTDSTVLTMGWTAREDLVVLYASGHVDIYNIRGDLLPTSFQLIVDAARMGKDTVIMGVIGESALACIVEVEKPPRPSIGGAGAGGGAGAVEAGAPELELQLLLVEDLLGDDPVGEEVAASGLVADFPPRSMALIEPRFTSSGRVEILLGDAQYSVLVVAPDPASGEYAAEDQRLSDKLGSPVLAMAVSPNGRFIALMGTEKLTVMGTNFASKLLEFNTASEPPTQLVWCNEDSVVMSWPRKGLLMVGPYGHYHPYEYDEAMVLVQDCDCVRVISDTTHEVLQRVPPSTEAIRQIGSDAPGALLFDAMDSFDHADAKADDTIRSLQGVGELPQAVRENLSAAGAEWDTAQQRALLKAAAYGKNFDPDADVGVHNVFVATCKKLRVLNRLRDIEVAMPLSVTQYDRLTPDVVIDRLLHRHQHRLALQLCSYLRLDRDRVLVHWACAKIEASSTAPASEAAEQQLASALHDMLARTAGAVSYADIAATADAAARPALARALLEYEPRPADQVPLLLKMRAHDKALEKAISSGDTDLVYLVLLTLKHSLIGNDDGTSGGAGGGAGAGAGAGGGAGGAGDLDRFFEVVTKHAAAVNHLIAYLRHGVSPGDRLLLVKLLLKTGRVRQQAEVMIREAYLLPRLEGRLQLLMRVINFVLKPAIKAGAKYLDPLLQFTTDQVKLLQLQQKLEGAHDGVAFVDLSVTETLYQCIVFGLDREAAAMKKEFSVPDTRFWHVKISALAKSQKWSKLEAFASEKKSPIGYEPFVEACVAQRRLDEAAKYVPRISDADDRVEAWMRTEHWEEAGEEALKIRGEPDEDAVREILSHCRGRGNPALVARLEAALQ